MQSLKLKWSLTLVITSLVGIVLVGLIATQSNSTEYQRFRNTEITSNLVEIAGNYYEQNRTFLRFERQLMGSIFRPIRMNDRRSPIPFVIANMQGRVIIASDNHRRFDIIPQNEIGNGQPIYANGKQVGTLLITAPLNFDEAEIDYLRRTNTLLLIGAIGAVVVAVILGMFLSTQFLRPLAELTDAIGSIQQGKFDQRVPVRSRDELGKLAQAFNQMGEELQRVNQVRRQMTADIAHDLRTPLTVISGYLEGLRDGSLKPTQARFDTLYQETQLLKRLIEDLRTLSLADAGELQLKRQNITPDELLKQVKASFDPIAKSQQIHLMIEVSDALPTLQIDRERMIQVLGNLVSNSLRFTPINGTIKLSAHQVHNQIELTVQDNGSGIAPEHLPNIFARFYRISESRQQNQQESGLGLAIAKSIVTAHNGTIVAESQPTQGTIMRIRLPITTGHPPESGRESLDNAQT